MVENTQERAKKRLTDDIVRTVIFFFASGMAIYFLVSYNNFVNVIAALVFMIVGGNNMRRAWFPYGKIVESLFWVALSSVGFVAAILFRAFGEKDATSMALMMGFLVLYSLWDTYRSIRYAQRALKAMAQQQQQHTDPPS